MYHLKAIIHLIEPGVHRKMGGMVTVLAVDHQLSVYHLEAHITSLMTGDHFVTLPYCI